MTIEYVYCEDGVETWDTVDISEHEAIALAEDELGAVRADNGQWIYVADETDEAYWLSREEVLMAGAAIAAGREDWYSLWCAMTGRPASRRARDRYLRVPGLTYPWAVEMGRRGGLKGGPARAAKLTPEQRSEIARRAARARWARRQEEAAR